MSAIVARKRRPKRFEPGSTLKVKVGTRMLTATVLEDLGPIAPDGKHVVRLRASFSEEEEPSDFELSLDVEAV
jgi:hypothetical protein